MVKIEEIKRVNHYFMRSSLVSSYLSTMRVHVSDLNFNLMEKESIFLKSMSFIERIVTEAIANPQSFSINRSASSSLRELLV